VSSGKPFQLSITATCLQMGMIVSLNGATNQSISLSPFTFLVWNQQGQPLWHPQILAPKSLGLGFRGPKSDKASVYVILLAKKEWWATTHAACVVVLSSSHLGHDDERPNATSVRSKLDFILFYCILFPGKICIRYSQVDLSERHPHPVSWLWQRGGWQGKNGMGNHGCTPLA
jgi:hypothetical protein